MFANDWTVVHHCAYSIGYHVAFTGHHPTLNQVAEQTPYSYEYVRRTMIGCEAFKKMSIFDAYDRKVTVWRIAIDKNTVPKYIREAYKLGTHDALQDRDDMGVEEIELPF